MIGHIDIPNWKVYSDDAKNARLWFEGYGNLAESGMRLLDERDRLRRQVQRLRKRNARPSKEAR